MSREIKFRGRISQGIENAGQLVYWGITGSDLIDSIDSDTIVQFTGLQDKNGVDIYDGDSLNVFNTSYAGEHIHDAIYKVTIDKLTGIKLVFVKMLWENFGHNQYPVILALCSEYGSLGLDYVNQEYNRLAVLDVTESNHISNDSWKTNDYSNYVEVIGNIYETPELLK